MVARTRLNGMFIHTLPVLLHYRNKLNIPKYVITYFSLKTKTKANEPR